ncbi:MAG: hypothetical protein ACOY3P_26015 [Planctomycetota bacterium]
MRERIGFTIEGVSVPIETVRVHLEPDDVTESRRFVLAVPSSYLESVFDPHGTRCSGTSMEAHVRGLIREMGSFVVHGYLRNVCGILNKKTDQYQWMIIAVDEVEEVDRGLVVSGKAVQLGGD